MTKTPYFTRSGALPLLPTPLPLEATITVPHELHGRILVNDLVSMRQEQQCWCLPWADHTRDCTRHLGRESESARAEDSRDSNTLDSLRRSNQALITWLTEKNTQVDFLQAESKQDRTEIEWCRAEMERYRMESEQHWVESDRYRAKSERYQAESNRHQAESERHRVESEQHQAESEWYQAESEWYRAVSKRLMNDLEAACSENNDLEGHFRRAQTQLRVSLSSHERRIVALPAILPHRAPSPQPIVTEAARQPSVTVLDILSEGESIPEPDTDGGPSAKERARKRKGEGQDCRKTKARRMIDQEHRYPTRTCN